ncbi:MULTISPECIES: acetyl-CoA carboxylase biotin carboxyl carrier protein [Fusobacterium]|uniref:acetyl-CoA carboxylase biotin carboxyl carrier protein n=1 Tax=Fusobacterium TaxID=848 RepID=UPI0014778958|nr:MULTISPECIES: acetyl-CoA carboxylase biotin carboxyl carrier protein [Fusobacterium]NME36107.1 acetyl-CoA carboxylase biotin carboxyl carrier protein [Fusobacterium sp. FSA-380-WT-3A]
MENISLELIEMLAKKMNERELNEITLEKGDEKITLKKEIKYVSKEIVTNKSVSKEKKVTTASSKTSDEKTKGNIVIAPMSGTFYRSPAPGEPHFVQEGDEVNNGDVVCIIEAMKMMNDVICKYSGKVVKILVENGEIVQKGDKLFVIE